MSQQLGIKPTSPAISRVGYPADLQIPLPLISSTLPIKTRVYLPEREFSAFVGCGVQKKKKLELYTDLCDVSSNCVNSRFGFTMWATLGEYPVDMPLSMATEADAHGVPRKKNDNPPDLVNTGDAGYPVPQTAPVTPSLDSIYCLPKEHTLYISETIASLSRQHQLPCSEMTLE